MKYRVNFKCYWYNTGAADNHYYINFKDFDTMEEAVTQNNFMEIIHCEHDDLMIKLLPEKELKNYREIIQQLRKVNFKDKLGYVIRYYKKLDKDAETSVVN